MSQLYNLQNTLDVGLCPGRDNWFHCVSLHEGHNITKIQGEKSDVQKC